jgi:hypothetical protein
MSEWSSVNAKRGNILDTASCKASSEYDFDADQSSCPAASSKSTSEARYERIYRSLRIWSICHLETSLDRGNGSIPAAWNCLFLFFIHGNRISTIALRYSCVA